MGTPRITKKQHDRFMADYETLCRKHGMAVQCFLSDRGGDHAYYAAEPATDPWLSEYLRNLKGGLSRLRTETANG